MRVKFNENDDVPKLEFGKLYDISFYACSFWWHIKFTRKNTIIIEEMVIRKMINNVPHVDIRRKFKMSKRELKQFLREKDFIQWVCEVEVS